MRQNDDILHVQQGAVGRRIRVQHIKPSPINGSGIQRVDESLLVSHRSSTGGDVDCMLLHHVKLLLAKQLFAYDCHRASFMSDTDWAPESSQLRRTKRFEHPPVSLPFVEGWFGTCTVTMSDLRSSSSNVTYLQAHTVRAVSEQRSWYVPQTNPD